jgi:hypothetical protein
MEASDIRHERAQRNVRETENENAGKNYSPWWRKAIQQHADAWRKYRDRDRGNAKIACGIAIQMLLSRGDANPK